MSPLAWIFIAIIVVLIVFKNWDKIRPLFEKKERIGSGEFKVELSTSDVNKAKEERLQTLYNEKEKRLQKIEYITKGIKEEIKEIDIEIFLIEGKNNNKKDYGWRKK